MSKQTSRRFIDSIVYASLSTVPAVVVIGSLIFPEATTKLLRTTTDGQSNTIVTAMYPESH